MSAGLHQFDPSALQGAAGVGMLVVVFVIRAFVSGALTEAGKDAWRWLRTWTARSGSIDRTKPSCGAEDRRAQQATSDKPRIIHRRCGRHRRS